ncbi:MAG: undecaprenyl-phosphate glucose phosphotransferase, partial [Ignavibacteriales bacterium]|nr:undecaprenyl-phosphate glucose phosphotransferase [Ignavibacteriales bacterium]
LERNYMFILLLISNIIWISSARIIKQYDNFTRRVFFFQILPIIKLVIIQVLVAILFIFFTKEDLFTRNFILYFSIGLFFTVAIKDKLIKMFIKRQRRKGIGVRNIIIIGTGELADNFANFIKSNPVFGYKVSGFLDDIQDINNSLLLGKINDLEQIIKEKEISEVVIALPLSKADLIEDIIKKCDVNALNSYVIPDYFKFLSNKFTISLFGNFPLISIRSNPLDEMQWRFIKRLFDLTISISISILFLWWLIPIIGLLIKINSKGPIFFIQERVGKDGMIFKCTKFRTMTLKASLETNSDMPVTENDSRVTKIGSFLRKTNLDEIPQFINVLKGDMSIVGPRPHAIPFNRNYTQMVEEIRLRHRIKPGITGWAQVRGLRGDVFDFEENRQRTQKRIERDIWYIENWTFWLDIQILFETIWQIFRGKNKGN